MALTITHAFVSQKADPPSGSATGIVRASDWNSTHTIVGTVDESLLSFNDVTSGNASTAHHGLLPKLSNNANQFLNGTGTFTTPSGSTNYWTQSGSIIYYTGGNVGLGETNPQAPLQITHDTTTNTLGTGIILNSVSGGDGCGLSIVWRDNENILSMGAISGIDDDHWGGRLVFFTSPQTFSSPGGSLTERMRITSVGNVGIGSTNPQSLLEVAGNIQSVSSSSNVNTVSPSSSPVFDCSLGDVQYFTTNGDFSPTFINLTAGQILTLVVIQDAGAPRNINWPDNVYGGMTLGSVGNSFNCQSFVCPDGENLIAVSFGVVNIVS